MIENTVDRRVKRTHRLLMDALISLSVERGYGNVTIRDITERADTAYSTFFRHYPDKDALLVAMIGEEVNALMSLTRQLKKKTPFEIGRLLFEHVDSHEAFYRVILSGHGTNPVLDSVQEHLQQEIIRQYAPNGEPAFPIEIIAHQHMTAILALIQWWLSRAKPYPVEEMARIYAEMISIPLERAAFESRS